MKFFFEHQFFVAIICVGLLSVASGCNNEEAVRSYSVDKPADVHEENHVESQAADAPTAAAAKSPHQPAAASKPARMFAAIVPRGADVWYYKMTGPVEAVASLAKPMAEFIGTVKYEGDKAVWTLPAGWEQKPGNQFRFATLMVPSDTGPLEFAVSRFNNGPDEVLHAVANINRWRGQLGLGEIKSDDVNKSGEEITEPVSKQKIGEQTIYFVNIVGKQGGQSGRPPFAR